MQGSPLTCGEHTGIYNGGAGKVEHFRDNRMRFATSYRLVQRNRREKPH